ncbi:MAG: hypothetical protein R3F56_01050 [Planctomycetota bacterium]
MALPAIDRGQQAPAHGAAAAEARQNATLTASSPSPRTAPTVELEWHGDRLRRRDRLADAGTRTPARVDKVAAGIRCPDGTFLPLLNGVREAPGIIRESERGPLPPVVALVVDADGWEWYEHADGSMSTSRPQRLVDQQGHDQLQAVTLHVAHLPPDGLLPPEPRPQRNDR